MGTQHNTNHTNKIPATVTADREIQEAMRNDNQKQEARKQKMSTFIARNMIIIAIEHRCQRIRISSYYTLTEIRTITDKMLNMTKLGKTCETNYRILHLAKQ